VSKNKARLPKEVVAQWPDILKDIEVQAVPVEYLHSVRITFSDGKVWEIDTNRNPEDVNLEEALESLLDEYEDSISSVDFRLDTEKVKNDIKKRTATFLKKRK
jgi:hypothetical protein